MIKKITLLCSLLSAALPLTVSAAQFIPEYEVRAISSRSMHSMPSPYKQQPGTLTVITGPMFCGKTEEGLRLVRRAEIAGMKTITIKYHLDNRISKEVINSHAGKTSKAISSDGSSKSLQTIDKTSSDAEMIFIEEVQFFPKTEILTAINRWVKQGKHVIVAGLAQDFAGRAFGAMPELMVEADDVLKLKAICTKCGNLATRTQRIVNGIPAHINDSVVLVGGEDAYEARCRKCLEIRGLDEQDKK